MKLAALGCLSIVALVAGCSNNVDSTKEDVATGTADLTTVDTTHTGVGSMVYRNWFDHKIYQMCSGTLISPTVFLTAGHCTIDAEAAATSYADVYVTFDQAVTGSSTLIPVTAHTAPDFNMAAYNINSDSHDVGVLVLATPVTNRPITKLPGANTLSAAHPAPGTPITSVGYGIDASGSGGQVTYANDTGRNSGILKYRAATAYIMADQVHAGGMCFGDSGGPSFITINGAEQLVGINVVINGYDCNEVAWLYRLDSPSTRAFLGQYVTLP